jgi:NAD(P)-dependent dehydrogenase (short-subunit alcohol dehydrogenase family)
MPAELDGSVALVTGGASGIGAAAARLFAERGASVVVADRDATGGASVARAIEADGLAAAFVEVDVADEASVDAMVAFAVDRYGRLDCAFNNAGISGAHKPFVEHSLEEWRAIIDVDLTGVFLCLRAEIAQMCAQGGGGAIVNTSSGAAVTSSPGQPAYTAAKHGVLGLTKLAAAEHGRDGIRVNAILPGMTATPLLQQWADMQPERVAPVLESVPLRRMASPTEMAETAVWLCSPGASYVNGASLVVDGGLSIG